MDPLSYAFVYDEALSERRFEREVAAIETRLTTLGVTGRTIKLAMFRSANETIESMVKHGVTTVVVVGNDRTLDALMWFLPAMNVVLGYLPILGPSRIAKPLGIPLGVSACDVLAARLIETIDVGLCDGRFFLGEAGIKNTSASITVDGRFSLTPIGGGSITVRNLYADAKDGALEITVRPATNRSRFRARVAQETRILMRQGEIVSPTPIDLHVDEHCVNGLRFQLGIAPRKLKVIAGRSRQLAPSESPRKTFFEKQK